MSILGSGPYTNRAPVGITRLLACRVTLSSMFTKALSVSLLVLHIDRTIVLQYIHTYYHTADIYNIKKRLDSYCNGHYVFFEDNRSFLNPPKSPYSTVIVHRLL